MESSREAVIVPLVPLTSEPSTEAMLRMLLNREALLVDHVPTATKGAPSGMVAQGTGAFAKAISQVTAQFSHAETYQGLYRAFTPTGAVARDLVPAVGGGFRGLVRGASTTKLAGHARLVPAAAGTGATIAAGPLIATVGLAVSAEMLSQHQTNKKLEAISSVLVDLQGRADQEERSILATAGGQASKVASYLLDQASIPSISSASHAFGELDTLTSSYISRLGRWSDSVAKQLDAERVYAPDLLKVLVGKREDPIGDFERMVAQTYEALALRARVVVLEKVAAELSNPNRSLHHVQSLLRSELSDISDHQARLVRLLEDLSVMQLDSSKVPVAFAGKGTLAARTSFSRMSRLLHAAPSGIPILSESDQTVLELEPGSDGMKVVKPTS